MSVPASDNLRRAASVFPRHAEVTELILSGADLLEAIDALHQPDVTGEICDQCEFYWPCQTARLLHPEEADRG